MDHVHQLAKDTFGFDLYADQEEAIASLLAGRDTFAILPTGAGKSAIYQLAGLALPGLTVVVSPLIALQFDQLDMLGDQVDAAVLNSALTKSERAAVLEEVTNATLRFLFLAPEQFGNEDTVAVLQGADVSLFVVDEAHCVSGWGHDFRPDYLEVGGVRRRLGVGQEAPTMLALTATASPPVREEIVSLLKMTDPKVIAGGFDRPNLTLNVETFLGGNGKQERLIQAAADAPKPGIIYAATREETETLARALCEGGVKAAAYHAGLPNSTREAVQEGFLEDSLEVVCATVAFGMGIDKANVRFVFHAEPADSLDSYYQEIGRAGRDGETAQVCLFYDPDDLGLRRFMNAALKVGRKQLEKIVTSVQRGVTEVGELRERLELSDSKLLSALHQLETLDVLALDSAGETITPAEGLEPADAVEEATEQESARREFVRSRLEMMKGYAETRSCRRAYLLGYFGEAFTPPCGACDVCLADGRAASDTPTEVPFPLSSRVSHQTFGEGQVTHYEADKVTVLFDEEGYQTLSLSLVTEKNLLTPVTDT